MTARTETVCLIHSHLGPALSRLGCRVAHLDPPGGTASLPELLAALPEPPDCVVHQEHLGRRLVLTDLAEAPCPTVFWSLDTHLNAFWQRHYAQGFSAVATTQPHLRARLAARPSRPAAWIPWHGAVRPFVPHAVRPDALAFVGRLTPERHRRRWFLEHLVRFGLAHRQDAFGEALGAAYDAARVVPNECIAGEVNLRLFEAASSGCLPVTPRAPEGVEALFVPDREAFYYDDVLELDERLGFALAHPDLAERLGRAARAAVAARHLPEHRAAALRDLMAEAGPPPSGPEARASTALAVYHLNRAGQLATPRADIWRLVADAPGTPPVMAARLQLALADGNRELTAALCALCLTRPELAGDARSACACALAALRLGDGATAARAYVGLLAASGRRDAPRLQAPRDYLLFFAKALEGVGEVAAPGMPFDPAIHLPETAAQCLIAAKAPAPHDPEIERRLEALWRRLPGTEAERVGLLSDLTLRKPDDWSLGLELGLANLRGYRLEAGVEEVRLAAATAARLAQSERFARRLAAADPSGRLSRAAFGGQTA
ncbi:MAG: glycosyltransferase [Solidesulfovibrio sp.]|uniref:glycosyltransferase n=1 Tax=Solidesulfovibrio sp. TaxID=2910990 RepID=UPI002B20C012|nr:glycosyltransferase [Solidesulfovibrio sp.]MEA4858823.1 glycosyltransferase [Solidesulfovibrio sp.]